MSEKEVVDWQTRWRSVYAKKLHAETKEWVYREYDWHVFNFNKHQHSTGEQAWLEYRRLSSGSFLVFSAYIHQAFGFACNGKPPDRLDTGADVIVAPPSLAWTMAFNHERYGPYFAVP